MLPWIMLSWSIIFFILAIIANGMDFITLASGLLSIAKILFLISAILIPISLFYIRRTTGHHYH
jgi:uncharacterized membrane protein YtjA (UPF0391 family)